MILKVTHMGIIKFFGKILLGIWDFFFMFFGMPYEKQAERLQVDGIDLRGPENEKTGHQYYRANRVSNDKKSNNA